MRAGKNRLAFASSIISIVGLLYSPLCALSCAISNCPSLEAGKPSRQSQQSSHCHTHDLDKHSEAQQTGSGPQPGTPRPHKDSGGCLAHSGGAAVLSSAAKAPTPLQQNGQSIATPSETARFCRDVFAANFREGRSFRSPPKRAVISVYRL